MSPVAGAFAGCLLYWDRRRNSVVLLIEVAAMIFWSGILCIAKGFERLKAGFHSRTVGMGDGRISYLDTEKGKKAILLLHGFAGDKDNWDRFVSHIPGQWRCIAPDLPGFGSSTGFPDGCCVLSEQMHSLRSFLDKLGVQSVHLVGNSMGAHVAFLFAARYPERVLSLTAFDSSGIEAGRKSPEFRHYEQTGLNGLLVNTIKDYDRLLQFLFEKIPWLPWPVRGAMAREAIQKRPFFEKAWRIVFYDAYEPLEPILPNVKCPVLLVWGDHDRIMDISSLPVLAQAIEHARLEVFKDCGHLPVVEQPERSATLLLDFIGSGRVDDFGSREQRGAV